MSRPPGGGRFGEDYLAQRLPRRHHRQNVGLALDAASITTGPGWANASVNTGTISSVRAMPKSRMP